MAEREPSKTTKRLGEAAKKLRDSTMHMMLMMQLNHSRAKANSKLVMDYTGDPEQDDVVADDVINMLDTINRDPNVEDLSAVQFGRLSELVLGMCMHLTGIIIDNTIGEDAAGDGFDTAFGKMLDLSGATTKEELGKFLTEALGGMGMPDIPAEMIDDMWEKFQADGGMGGMRMHVMKIDGMPGAPDHDQETQGDEDEGGFSEEEY